MMELNLLSNGQRAFRGYDHIFLGRGGSRRKVGGRSRKVHGGMGAALLSENRVRRGGKKFGFEPHDVGLAQFVAHPALLGGRSSRKVHGGNRNRMHGFEVVRAGGSRSGRKVHGGNRMYVRAGGSRRKVGGGQRWVLV